MATILAVSSMVARGHVGNSAASFPLMRRGHDVIAVPTILLGHHFGHRRQVARIDIPDLHALVHDAIASPKPYRVDGVLIGYLALPAQAADIAGIVAEARAERPGIPVLLDPVAGDFGRLYVDPTVLDAIVADLLPLADAVTPNLTELVALTDRARIEKAPKLSEAEIVQRARALGPSTVIVTSAPPSKAGTVANLIVTEELAVRVETPHVDVHVHGTGDLMSALVLGEIVAGSDTVPAVATAAAIVHDVLVTTRDLGRDELALVEAQKKIAQPDTTAEVALL